MEPVTRRRTLVLGGAGVAAIAGLSGISSAKKPASSRSNKPASSGSKKPATSIVKVGTNRLDINNDGKIDVIAERTKNPDGHGSATHVTSEGVETPDYLTSVGNVTGAGITLGDFEGPSPATLTYDYYVGDDNTNPAPDEVWLKLVESDGTEHIVRLHDTNPNVGQSWTKRPVGKEIRGIRVNQGFKWNELGEGFTDTDLTSIYARDTQITRVGVGYGTTSGGVVLDAYFKDLKFNGNRIATFSTGRGK